MNPKSFINIVSALNKVLARYRNRMPCDVYFPSARTLRLFSSHLHSNCITICITTKLLRLCDTLSTSLLIQTSVSSSVPTSSSSSVYYHHRTTQSHPIHSLSCYLLFLFLPVEAYNLFNSSIQQSGHTFNIVFHSDENENICRLLSCIKIKNLIVRVPK